MSRRIAVDGTTNAPLFGPIEVTEAHASDTAAANAQQKELPRRALHF